SLEHSQQLLLVVLAHSRGATAEKDERIGLTANLGNQRRELRVLLRRHARDFDYTWSTGAGLGLRVRQGWQQRQQRGSEDCNGRDAVRVHVDLPRARIKVCAAMDPAVARATRAPAQEQQVGPQHARGAGTGFSAGRKALMKRP